MLDKRLRGVTTDHDEEGDDELSRVGLEPLNVKTLALYRIDVDNDDDREDDTIVRVKSDEDVQSHFHDHSIYCLSDETRGAPSFEEGERYVHHKNIKKCVPTIIDEDTNEEICRPPDKIIQDHVDHFEVTMFGGKYTLSRGTYRLHSSMSVEGYAEYDPRMHNKDFYRVYEPNALLIDDIEDAGAVTRTLHQRKPTHFTRRRMQLLDEKHTLCAPQRLAPTIFTDSDRIKMVISILEGPVNDYPRGAELNLKYMLTSKQIAACFVMRSQEEALVLDRTYIVPSLSYLADVLSR